MTWQSLGSLPLSIYKVIAAYKPEDTTIAKVLLHLRKVGVRAIAHPAPLVPMPMLWYTGLCPLFGECPLFEC